MWNRNKGDQVERDTINTMQTHTKERGCERLFYSVGVDNGRSKGESNTKDYLEKEKTGWKSWDVAKAVAWNIECWSENVTEEK